MLFMGRWLGEDKRQCTLWIIFYFISYCDYEGEKDNKIKEEQNQTKLAKTTESHNPKSNDK